MLSFRALIRWSEWLTRLLIAIANCGPRAAVEILVLSRRSSDLRRVTIARLGRAISFRGRLDYGVMSHFYKPSFRIVDPQCRIRWIVDAGANIGDETIKFRAFNPGADVLAIEADPANARVLQLNAQDDPKIHVESKALWPKAGETLSLVRTGNPEGTAVVDAPGEVKVETTSFDELRRIYGIDRFDIVKLDIEGAERYLFADGNTSWLEHTDVLIMEVADHENPGGLQRLLRAMPYETDCQIIGEVVVAIRPECGLSAERYTLL
jgi:FkbM family methyltransferase